MAQRNEADKKKSGYIKHLVDFLSFGSKVRELVDVINTEIASPQDVSYRPISHPAGFSNLIWKRRLTIAEAYVRILAHQASQSYVDRIESLQTMMHYMAYSDHSPMPINMARVQIALMKNAVKMRGDREAQLKIMSDFMWASCGKERAIRQLLKELDMIEVSEHVEEEARYEQILAWDDHLHDSMTEGRKSPTQLVLDAFIKGISRISISYYDLSDKKKLEEVFLAAHILHIRVQVAIGFSVGEKGERRRYLFIPPECWSFDSFCEFIDRTGSQLRVLYDGLEENARRRHEMIYALVEHFNQHVLPEFNAGYEGQPPLMLESLSRERVEEIAQQRQVNRIHLGLIVYELMNEVCHKRVLYLKSRCALPNATDEDRERLKKATRAYEELTPSVCASKYIAKRDQIDYASTFATEADILPVLAGTGAYVAYIRVQSHGVGRAMDVVMDSWRWLTDIEVYNLVDVQKRGVAPYVALAEWLGAIERGDLEAAMASAAANGATPRPRSDYEAVSSAWQVKPIYARCASDSVGWSATIPGMGFFPESLMDTEGFKRIRGEDHEKLPEPVSNLLRAHRLQDSNKTGVYLLSSMKFGGEWGAGERVLPKQQNIFLRFWRYLNINARCLILMAIGAVPAYLCLGIEFTILWFVLTASRNAIVDLISSAGIGPKHWKFKSIDKSNLCTSLFFTGFSVPIMSAAKLGFDSLWTGPLGYEASGFWFTFIKFWVIALANGLYLATHNTLRGFDKAAVRGNFFRSILSWPLAAGLSVFLTPLGVPDVVQAKLASEVVAGCIEGTVKFRRHIAQTRQALLEIYRQVSSSNATNAMMARVDVMYFWGCIGLGRRALAKFLYHPDLLKLSADDLDCIKRGNAIIQNQFLRDNDLEQMTYTILSYYPNESLDPLTDLVCEQHQPFAQWLKRDK